MKGQFKRWSQAARESVEKAQDLLKRYGIDVEESVDNLTWAENEGHSAEYARKVWERLEQVEARFLRDKASKEEIAAAIRRELRAIGKEIEDDKF